MKRRKNSGSVAQIWSVDRNLIKAVTCGFCGCRSDRDHTMQCTKEGSFKLVPQYLDL